MSLEDYKFRCLKCYHVIYTDDPKKLVDYSCPNCGEEWFENYAFMGMGVFQKSLNLRKEE